MLLAIGISPDAKPSSEETRNISWTNVQGSYSSCRAPLRGGMARLTFWDWVV